MKLADPGVPTEPREFTASQSRPADIFTTAGAALDVCVASSIAAAARGDAAQAAFDLRISGTKSENGGNRTFTTGRQCGQRTDGRTQPSLGHFRTRQTSLPAETAADVGEIPSSQVEA